MTPRRPASRSASLALLAGLAGCVTSTESGREVRIQPDHSYAVYDPLGRPTAAGVLGDAVWQTTGETAGASAGTRDPAARDPASSDPASQDPEDQDPAAQDREAQRRREAQLRTTFGDAVIIGTDGRLTKTYTLSGQSGQAFVALVTPIGQDPAQTKFTQVETFGGKATNTVLGQMLGPDREVEVVLIENFLVVENMTFPKVPTQEQARPAPTGSKPSALLLVTAQPSSLLAFEQALNLFFADLPQIEIEVKVAEFQSSDSLSIGITPTSDTTPTLQNLSSGKLVQEITSDFLLTPPALGATIRDRGLFTIGGIHDGWELSAVISTLATEGRADVKSYPKLVVQNGGLATIVTQTELPFPKARFTSDQNLAVDIQFKDVGIVMHIRPEIAGTDSVNLLINASVSAVTGFADTEPVDTPIIATRSVSTSVHLADGKALAIGGLLSQQKIEQESKIPILGDIPLLGLLFRSTSVQNSHTEVVFTITPRIMRGQRGRRASPLGF